VSPGPRALPPPIVAAVSSFVDDKVAPVLAAIDPAGGGNPVLANVKAALINREDQEPGGDGPAAREVHGIRRGSAPPSGGNCRSYPLMRDRPGREAAAASTLPGAPAPIPDVEEIEHTEEAMAPPWLTILHNCDCHTFEQVVRQLMKAIGCSESRGWEIAWEVHNTGKAVVKVGAEGECVRVGNVLAAIGLVVTVVQS
jgi:ATP-dependent Clp protease adaptor protein ClpS